MTPGTKGVKLLRNPSTVVTKEEDEHYRSGTGLMIFLIKHSRPDLNNPVRELSKALDCPSPAAYKEMLRVMKFSIDTEELGSFINPYEQEIGMWEILAFSASDFAFDIETRISVARFIIYVIGAQISWRSKGMKSVTLTSSEA